MRTIFLKVIALASLLVGLVSSIIPANNRISPKYNLLQIPSVNFVNRIDLPLTNYALYYGIDTPATNIYFYFDMVNPLLGVAASTLNLGKFIHHIGLLHSPTLKTFILSLI